MASQTSPVPENRPRLLSQYFQQYMVRSAGELSQMLETLPLRTQTTPTMIYDTLPTRSEFLATQLDIHRQCSICHEEFNLVHAPTRLTGRSSCNHVFGLTCICEWLLSGLPTANKCPMCRTLLFAPGKEREEDDDDYGDMPALTRLGPEEGGEDGDDEGDGNDSESSDREESSDEEDSDEDEGSSLFDDYVNHDGEQADDGDSDKRSDLEATRSNTA